MTTPDAWVQVSNVNPSLSVQSNRMKDWWSWPPYQKEMQWSAVVHVSSMLNWKPGLRVMLVNASLWSLVVLMMLNNELMCKHKTLKQNGWSSAKTDADETVRSHCHGNGKQAQSRKTVNQAEFCRFVMGIVVTIVNIHTESLKHGCWISWSAMDVWTASVMMMTYPCENAKDVQKSLWGHYMQWRVAPW
jgi:hypothetical protein